MGGCCSDLKGGKEAVGGATVGNYSNNNGNGAHNDAVDFFYTSQGFQPLFTQLEVHFLSITVTQTHES